MEIKYKPIGIISSPFETVDDMPIQPASARGIIGEVLIYDEYSSGLNDLDGFSHIILIYHFHKVKKQELMVKPFLDDTLRGIFATRSPIRPNPIGLSIVKLIDIKGLKLIIENVDIINNTPLLDIKPFVPNFDYYDQDYRIGWLENNINKSSRIRSDKRF
jgi:tRNA (adenine37-N6)-methyltransferase